MNLFMLICLCFEVIFLIVCRYVLGKKEKICYFEKKNRVWSVLESCIKGCDKGLNKIFVFYIKYMIKRELYMVKLVLYFLYVLI